MKYVLVIFVCFVNSSVFATSCNDEQYRHFDFWLGEWQVYTPDGKLVGTNIIEASHQGCVLRESYRATSGYTGESVNIFDKSRGVWHQSWVDSSGLLLQLEGGFDGESMVLSGASIGQSGQAVTQKITWTPQVDGSVRQLWEMKGVEGNWQILFDGKYVRN
ncbi:hypothetical protein PALB_25040 [Pseudoalteromonas luteoviolacea B = ATCC 29581]|nr:hypothetical protein PALB_25040 [Pseudoalteromonas luteoviolacea B = ATCC 29581]